MRHYVLTASSRTPNYPLDANRRRIALCRGITARSLAAQGTEWTWIVYINPDDPLLDERLDAFRSAGAPVVPITDSPERVIDWSGAVLTTRIDDDDGFADGAFRRLHAALARPPRRRRALVFPSGYRIHDGRAEQITHRRNAWSSVYAPKGDRAHVRMVQHHLIATFAPVQFLSPDPAWLWVRHQDAATGFRRATGEITNAIRDLYSVDWSLLE